MPFGEAVKACLHKYATVSGRAGRPEFWWFMLFVFLVLLATHLVHEWLGKLAFAALVVPSLAAAARRLHDIGKSAWFLLLAFVPVIGNLLLLYWYLQPSDAANQFGGRPAPPQVPTFLPGPGPGP